MELIYICSPYRGNVEFNTHIATIISRIVALSGDIPITPHIYFTQFLMDNDARERSLGFEFNDRLLRLCKRMYVIGKPTHGMKKEISIGEKLEMNIMYFDSLSKFKTFKNNEKEKS